MGHGVGEGGCASIFHQRPISGGVRDAKVSIDTAQHTTGMRCQ